MTHLELIHSKALAKYDRDAYNKTMQRRIFKKLGKDVVYHLVCGFVEVVPHGAEVKCHCK